MKRSILFMIFFTLILINGILASEFSNCNKDCVKDTQNKINDCTSNFSDCSNNANQKLKDCSFNVNKNVCIKETRLELTKCVNDKKICLKNIENNMNRCKKKCFYVGKNITCESKYNAGDVFLKGCNKCECNGNGRVSCKTSEYCNFNELVNSKEECVSGMGLFQKLCAGSIMSTKCTQEIYCQCGGNLNLSCNNDSICLYDFSLNNKRGFQFSQGWIEFPEYKKLGNIGICVKKPAIESCGDGICDNVCDKDDCRLAETSYNCPEDCKK